MDRNKRIYEYAIEYVLGFEQINREMLDAQLNEWRTQTKGLTDLSKIFHVMIDEFITPQGKGNYIGSTDNLRQVRAYVKGRGEKDKTSGMR